MTTGLRFPDDLDAWQRWQQRRSLARAAVRRLRGGSGAAATYVLGRRGSGPARVAVALESHGSSSLLSLGEPLRHLDVPLAVLVPTTFDTTRLPGDYAWEPWDGTLGSAVASGGTILSGGHYLPLGATLHPPAADAGVRYATVQHGLMTPWAPPLGPGTTLLAWSDADAAFWRAGRADVETVTLGSQLLWNAAAAPSPHVSRFEPPVFLGQLHGAELPRRGMARAASDFCRTHHATYRPHPSEQDRLSRLQHAAWERRGIAIDRSGRPLTEVGRPVVSAFSTGVLEAAARGVPAWVSYPDAPAWLADFWARYGMNEWGGEPTPRPDLPATEPARAIADWAKEQA